MALIRFVFVMVAAFLFAYAVPAFAEGITLEAGKETVVKISYRLQALTQFSKDQAGAAGGDPTVAGDQLEAYLRRSRLLIGGQVTPLFDFFLQLDDDNRGKNYSSSTGIKTRDAWIQLNLSPEWRIIAGVFPVQFSKSRLTSPFSFVALERPIIDEMQLDSTGLDGKRDRGVMLWGNMGGFQYRLAAGKGAKPQAREVGKESIRYHGRIQVSLLDVEDDFIAKESYMGGKGIFTVGCGFDKQDKASTDSLGRPTNYSAWTTDIAVEGKSESGLMSLSSAYYSYDWGNPEKKDIAGVNYVEGKGWQFTASYTVMDKSGVAVQPYVRYVTWNSASAAVASSQRSTSMGLNYFIKGGIAKIGFEYEQVVYPMEGATWDKKDHSVYIMLWQLSF